MEALRRQGEEKTRAVREQAEAEEQKARGEALERLDRLEAEFRERRGRALDEQSGALLGEAAAKMRRVRLEAEHALAERLWSLARDALPRLRGDGYPAAFAGLVGELHPLEWQTVRVNPADRDLAAGHFPGAEIGTDPGIVGGLEAVAPGGKVRVCSTWEKRLERAWDELLPGLFREIRRELEDDDAAAKS
ncbi:MAG: hypothetical protein C0617_11255 [Desulfuromonas sp.]|uniref:V-type ATP synthase subunit E family protein n=1 Tax=Desulfuromonas sp. TaxID=892 RepID=UPI000CC2232A|nr:V-type ATP synthase subunit E family protein [Desulfuromonas sp.]PLX83497.1 MAG: hypothetical protein C0617_11255 [Desulfuromonas sp.]